MNRHERRKEAAKLKASPGPHGMLILDRRDLPEGKCDLCSAEAELRPYGANGEWLCFNCAMQDKATTARKYREHVFGEPTH